MSSLRTTKGMLTQQAIIDGVREQASWIADGITHHVELCVSTDRELGLYQVTTIRVAADGSELSTIRIHTSVLFEARALFKKEARH